MLDSEPALTRELLKMWWRGWDFEPTVELPPLRFSSPMYLLAPVGWPPPHRV